MSNQFDDVSKTLASHQTRRGLIRLLGATVAGALVATLHPGGAFAKDDDAANCLKVCKRLTGKDYANCLRQCTCESIRGELCSGTSLCCPKGFKCQGTNGASALTIIVNGSVGTGHAICVPVRRAGELQVVPK